LKIYITVIFYIGFFFMKKTGKIGAVALVNVNRLKQIIVPLHHAKPTRQQRGAKVKNPRKTLTGVCWSLGLSKLKEKKRNSDGSYCAFVNLKPRALSAPLLPTPMLL
jgi:hypothetical protein